MSENSSKYNSCGCKTGCTNRRCSCLKNQEYCESTSCSCVNCENPLNGKDLTAYSNCAIDEMELINKIPIEQLQEKIVELPCGDTAVPLSELLDEIECPGCHCTYYLSFCWDQVTDADTTWHCFDCRTCRDWRYWHCYSCGNCNYGHSSVCEHCEDEFDDLEVDVDELIDLIKSSISEDE